MSIESLPPPVPPGAAGIEGASAPHEPSGQPVGAAGGEPGLWSPERRGLTIALVLTITLVAFESLAVATVMPQVKDDLGGLGLYGWVFSGFFLSSLLGIVVAGRLADRRGLAFPFAAGLVLFAVGLAVGGAATSMPMLVAARIAQGFGAGTIPPTAYAAIGRGYPASQRPKMFATTSTAWVVPGLIGPAIAAFVEHAASWRWVFLGLLPIVAVAALMGIPALAALGAPEQADAGLGHDGAADEIAARNVDDRRLVRRALVLVLGLGAVFAAGAGVPVAVGVPLVVVGLPAAVWAFIGLVPKGTLSLKPGVPATVGIRGVLTWAFFAADAYIPLAVVDGRHSATWIAATALSVGSVTWAGASWVQARLIDRHGPRRLDRVGFTAVAAGIALMIGVSQGLPTGVAVVAWAIGCFGIGLAYSPLSITVLAAARPGEEGAASSALQLSDAVGIAVGTGIGGWIVAAFDHGGGSVASSTSVVFAVALVMALIGLAGSSRLPVTVPEQATAD